MEFSFNFSTKLWAFGKRFAAICISPQYCGVFINFPTILCDFHFPTILWLFHSFSHNIVGFSFGNANFRTDNVCGLKKEVSSDKATDFLSSLLLLPIYPVLIAGFNQVVGNRKHLTG